MDSALNRGDVLTANLLAGDFGRTLIRSKVGDADRAKVIHGALRVQAIGKMPDLLGEGPQKVALRLLQPEADQALDAVIQCSLHPRDGRIKLVREPAKYLAERERKNPQENRAGRQEAALRQRLGDGS